MKTHLLGFDIGGTKCAVVLGKPERNRPAIVDRFAFPTASTGGPRDALRRLERTARDLLRTHDVPISNVRALGISCAGPLDSERGVVLTPPNLHGWRSVPITHVFEKAFRIPVRLEQDANACALAEWKWGAGRGCRNMIFLTFGTGMGAGLILNGALYRGTSDAAGEVGHVRLADAGPLGYGKRGSFEGFASGAGIANLAKDLIRARWRKGQRVAFCLDRESLAHVDAATVAEAARSGDRLAREVFQISGRYLGRGLAMLIDTLNPERIVIGSIFERARPLLWPAAQRELRREAIRASVNACRVVPAQLGDSIGDYAALSVASNAEPS